ncbi:serine/threonine-protein kinase [Kamptonema sp. UHCC 0994]|uniref:serine/threonine protein kinase n=1 Tax=Kamptonema sp. UHCC 0994 TaxID=3031329 RepID=UPI0023B8FEA9|nr:serine/threonine-protein kinase [Kamptonema sp. UHCC 0994]MDF0554696.1 serine/threonine-protein kinase [Kamptonema sp. UHCC 0994]
MNYCINPKCQNRQNSDAVKLCQACGTALLINDRYRILKPLRSLHLGHPTEIFEVEDWGTGEQEWGTHKVLKVLKYTNNSDLVWLFKQEARVLIWLRYPGIPKVEPDDYFRILPNSSSQYLHCLVMEKISGKKLDKYLEEEHHLSQSIIVDWLKQLIKILDVIHSQNLIHRDIKPSNIILKPDGKLALIDFGSVKIEAGESLPIGSLGYAPPEQLAGQAIQQSDFFALGRTLVYLLTGKAPLEFITNDTEKIIWRNSAIKIESYLADLIDEMMNIKPENRPQNTQLLLNKLKVFVTPPSGRYLYRPEGGVT